MPPVSRPAAALASELRTELAGDTSLSYGQARLYSHVSRLGWGVEGLQSWSAGEAQHQFDDAIRLIEAATILGAEDTNATACYRRAGDIFEWLDRIPDPAQRGNDLSAPLSLFAAACFQLAGLPAMASGVLNRARSTVTHGPLFAEFLKANFREVQTWTAAHWRRQSARTKPEGKPDADLQYAEELVRCVGLVATSIERDEQSRLELALRKLNAIAKFAARAVQPHTWLTLSLTARVAERYAATSLWRGVEPLRPSISPDGSLLLDAFVRNLFRERRGLLWPSQVQGVSRLAAGGSFAMCTPTGSGKTTIAELALVHTLHPSDAAASDAPPLVIYLVPSRALAAEVEARLQQDFRLIAPGMTVTGLYGGADWSLADVWLTATGPTVLISTVEMAESLLRFVGPLLLPRAKLAIIDEAHQVQFSESADSWQYLYRAEDRSARLEQFAARLFTNAPGCRAIALSAVAGGAEDNIARWFSASDTASAIGTNYRSTRQILGVLDCRADGSTNIRLELVNGQHLSVAGSSTEAYIPAPLPAMPKTTGRLRTTLGGFVRAHVLWAAVQLAHSRRKVLISVASFLNAMLSQCRELFADQPAWYSRLPDFFAPPIEGDRRAIYDACLAACEDYCGADSHEAFFLKLGIAVHHGQLPVRVRRLMTETVRAGITPITIATSTLTEGVNLPFDVILLASIIRPDMTTDPPQQEVIDAGEFLNLIGRAGRPGTGVEGITLVALPREGTSKPGSGVRREQEEGVRRDASRFENLLQAVRARGIAAGARSPIAALLNAIWGAWCRVAGSASQKEFLAWLEAARADGSNSASAPAAVPAELSDGLDALDQILLAAVEEGERLRNGSLSGSELEEHLQRLWSHTYARYAAQNAAWLERVFVTRGMAIPTQIYPDPAQRRRLYQLGLPPCYGTGFVPLATQIEKVLRSAVGFADWKPLQRYELFEQIAAVLVTDQRFRFVRLPTGVDWRVILKWWLQVPGSSNPPAEEVREWLRAGTSEFEMRLGVAISSTLSLVWNRVRHDSHALPDLDTWRALTEMPWAAFWLRELLAWGTLEPVVAHVIASGRTASRLAAFSYPRSYREWWEEEGHTDLEEMFHPRSIRRWSESTFPQEARNPSAPEIAIPVKLTRPLTDGAPTQVTVLPVVQDEEVQWFDGAGYHLATCDSTIPDHGISSEHDYALFPEEAVVRMLR